jgi:hypothetical protein
VVRDNRPNDRHAEHVGLELHEQVVGDHSAVDLQLRQRDAGVGVDRIEHLASLEGGGLERGARDVALVHEARQADQRAPGIRPPVWREQAGECRHEIGAAVVVDARSEGLDLIRGTDEAEVVAQPLHEGARHGDRPLEGVVRRLIPQLVAEGREQPVLRVDDLGARVEDQEVTGAVGVLRLARVECGLAECRGLLVSEDSGNGHLPKQAVRFRHTVDLGRAADLRQHRGRHAERIQDVLAPGQGREVHEHRAAGVRHVRCVHSTVDTAREVPEHPGVRRPEHQVARLGLLARALDVLEDPDDLGAGEICGQRKPDVLLESLDSAVLREAFDDVLRAGVLPDDGVVHRLARVPVPDDRGLALIGDADRGDVVTGEVCLREGLADDLSGVAPDLSRVVFDPPGPGEDLLMLQLAGRDDRARLVEDDRPAARRALIDREYVVGHR